MNTPVTHPSFASFWKDRNGNNPPIGMIITDEDIKSGKYIAVDKEIDFNKLIGSLYPKKENQ